MKKNKIARMGNIKNIEIEVDKNNTGNIQIRLFFVDGSKSITNVSDEFDLIHTLMEVIYHQRYKGSKKGK